MKSFQSNRLMWSTAVLSLALYAGSLALAHWDKAFTYRWVAFWMHISAVGVVVGVYIFQSLKKASLQKIRSSAELFPFVVIVLITEVANFLYLSSYQFVSISDELRDGGLFAMKISHGSIKNIFAYGSYEAHGLIIPVFTKFFYEIFGSSVLTYRVPTAILASLGIIFLYILIRRAMNMTTAFWTCFVLATMSLQMFFAHSQVVIGFNLLLIPILLMVYYVLRRHNGYIEYIVFGSLMGLSAGFHASLRAFVCVLFVMLFIEESLSFLRERHFSLHKVAQSAGKGIVLVVFIFVGFGPRVLFTSPSVFFHTSRLTSELKVEGEYAITPTRLNEIKNKYVKSLMIYAYEPTAFFYPDHKPFFSPFIALFFILGVGYSFFILRDPFVNRLLILLCVVPFFVSAITDVVNADHRVSVLFAVASIFAGIGISYALGSIRNIVFRYLLGIVIAVVLLMQVATYYIEKPANKAHDMKSYLHMHAMMKLQELTDAPMGIFTPGKGMKSGSSNEKYCLRVSPANYEYYTVDWGHKEQVEYFLPGTEVAYVGDEAVGENEVYIEKESCFSGSGPEAKYKLTRIECVRTKSFECPVDYQGEIRMYYE